jgi:precorrin-4/cobalt-precorrin-4 C11-methyltransferase
MNQNGHLYIIGTGPAGPQTATLQAIEMMKKMDCIIVIDEILELFKSVELK